MLKRGRDRRGLGGHDRAYAVAHFGQKRRSASGSPPFHGSIGATLKLCGASPRCQISHIVA
jgi:hypothetical protein